MDWLRRVFGRHGDGPRSPVSAAPVEPTAPADVHLPRGTRLGRYRIDGVLGRGGFGYTYRAADEKLGGEFAVKEYLPRGVAWRKPGLQVEPLSPAEVEAFGWGLDRFLAEARTLRQLSLPVSHPNIVVVRDYLELHGTGYLVMDFCEGQTLAQRLGKDGTLIERDLCPVLGPLLDGLERVHRACLVHRDIKPENICLRADGSPVLIDFGAARRAPREGTNAATMIFTPGYAPIEQYLGSGNVGPWTDIYALGATMYRAVTGRAPPESIERLHADELRNAVSVAQGRYAPRLLQAIDDALALRAGDRPQSVLQWRAAFGDLLDTATSEGAASSDQPMPSVDAFIDEQTELYRAGRLEDALASVLRARRLYGERAIFWNNQGTFLADLRRVREALDCYERGLELEPDYQHLWSNKGRTLRAMGRPLEALVCYDRAISLNASHPIPWDCKGNCLLDLGRNAEARACFERVVQLDPQDREARRKLALCA